MFQSTHSLRSATFERSGKRDKFLVSIHALLAECDLPGHLPGCPPRRFNPRTPCGVRPVQWRWSGAVNKFQSTHSLRSATHIAERGFFPGGVSIHALLAECDSQGILERLQSLGFNPRTPCGVRPGPVPTRFYLSAFQSTHSLRSATVGVFRTPDLCQVSIHALLAECDQSVTPTESILNGFNPRTPCGVRPATGSRASLIVRFQSTHSLRSAT